nr:hypothetical protein [candidate division KSB1 bacterium]NIR70592.1 hypothetical protein [candidate division KSB1 bacterium]NIS24537.1 hypothetical protein [candidate division KSB1 bacterium]NIT71455.1 hypothetical protein [candidate division KSB1 bacterium]NIU25146.1 hypothetical protein [candidate division KSB1 bacterium]
DSNASIILAEANQKAIQMVSSAIQNNELPVTFLLGEKYVEAMKGLSNSQNSKVVIMPADIPAAVRGIMSTLSK